jgi:HEAT repeat protein
MLREDPAIEVRASAAQALGKYVLQGELDELPQERVEGIRIALRDVFYDESEAIEVRRRALESIAYHDHEETRELIAMAYEDPCHEMRVSAVFAMGRSVDPYWRETVLRELDSPSPEIRFEAARACGELVVREAVPRLLDMLHEPDREIQEVVIWSLGQIGGNQAKQALQTLLQDEDEELSEAAEDALGELLLMEGEIAMPLYDFEVSDLEEIRLEDLEELDDLADVESLEELVERLEDEELA